ncbi:hypothetical protein E5676_scaffold507G00560 [Cucumis melo var. makuwa]|uniref:Uncharacterized protein n=1 Tax=Cucumis melo var. makuwa TaxID=1194695 RepID=A0A5D3BJW2_CUCMM|nr:hypothetical protein E6C27_scaffold498G00800 [Cucumis melo var. makuwa]TYJ98665.1 hypothetical protein E5676_scaffold507G00560 [Cucumis melo var. makuwa]
MPSSASRGFSRIVQPPAQPRRRTSTATRRSRRSRVALALCNPQSIYVPNPNSRALPSILNCRASPSTRNSTRAPAFSSSLRAQALQPRPRDGVVRRDCQSGIDIDMIRVIRRDPRSPIVLVFPSGMGRGKGKGKLASDQK